MDINQKVRDLVRLGILTRTTGTVSFHEDQSDFIEFGFEPELKTVSEFNNLYTLHKEQAQASKGTLRDRQTKLDDLVEKIKTPLSLSDDEAALLKSALR